MELSRVTTPISAWLRDRPAERADRAVQNLEDTCRRLATPGPTDKVKDTLRSSYSRNLTTSRRFSLGTVVSLALVAITTKAGWSWSGDAATVARNPDPQPYQQVVFFLCFVPMVLAGRHIRYDPRPDLAARKITRAVASCVRTRDARPADQDRYMRQLTRRLRAVDQTLQFLRSRSNSETYIHKKVWPARARLREVQGQLDTDRDKALQDLAACLMTVARQYVAGNYTNLLDLPNEGSSTAGEDPPKSYDWLRRLGTVAFAGAWIWWASGLPLEGWSQALTITVGPFLAFVLFYGIQLGFGFLDRIRGLVGQQEPAPTEAISGDASSDIASATGPSEGSAGAPPRRTPQAAACQCEVLAEGAAHTGRPTSGGPARRLGASA